VPNLSAGCEACASTHDGTAWTHSPASSAFRPDQMQLPQVRTTGCIAEVGEWVAQACAGLVQFCTSIRRERDQVAAARLPSRHQAFVLELSDVG
jgi:hypothetical protein